VVEGAATLATLGVRVSSLLASDLAIARRRHSMKIAGHGTRLAAVLAGSKFSLLAASTRGEAAFTAAGWLAAGSARQSPRSSPARLLRRAAVRTALAGRKFSNTRPSIPVVAPVRLRRSPASWPQGPHSERTQPCFPKGRKLPLVLSELLHALRAQARDLTQEAVRSSRLMGCPHRVPQLFTRSV
jgi:hypothetical protein